MLLINNIKFARNDIEFTQTLFQSKGTCLGFYKKVKAGYKLFDHNNNLFAFIHLKNKMIVSAYQKETKTIYSQSLSDTSRSILGIKNMIQEDRIISELKEIDL